ncbi:Uncharacterized protein FWK35_00006103 [Aphis craccivora]|uniref:Uncharacterized protein n=1 Tax=Aphis craccivora TaxID=307492 RepID=A0A6G0YV57_APHCR|nr:Uncharacterized protein FWK35_00006103 [Aphis craccivora]
MIKYNLIRFKTCNFDSLIKRSQKKLRSHVTITILKFINELNDTGKFIFISTSSSSSSIPLNDSAASSNGSSSEDDDDVDDEEVDDEGIGESLVSISTTDCFNKKTFYNSFKTIKKMHHHVDAVPGLTNVQHILIMRNSSSSCSREMEFIKLQRRHMQFARISKNQSTHTFLSDNLSKLKRLHLDNSYNVHDKVNCERSDECIDFTMMSFFFVSVYSISSRNNAPISNFGSGFRCKSEDSWCIIENKSKHFPTVFKKIEKNKKNTEKREFLCKTSFRPNIQKLIIVNIRNFHQIVDKKNLDDQTNLKIEYKVPYEIKNTTLSFSSSIYRENMKHHYRKNFNISRRYLKIFNVDKFFLAQSKYLKIQYKVPHKQIFFLLAFELIIIIKELKFWCIQAIKHKPPFSQTTGNYILSQGSPNFFIQGPQKISSSLRGPKISSLIHTAPNVQQSDTHLPTFIFFFFWQGAIINKCYMLYLLLVPSINFDNESGNQQLILPIVELSLSVNMAIIRPFCSISIVIKRCVDVDAIIFIKSSATVTAGALSSVLRPSDGKC